MNCKTSVRNLIAEEIREMGFNFEHVGTEYLIETIEIIYNSDNPTYYRSIAKNVYPIVAEKYSKNPSTVKSDIIKATDFRYKQWLKEVRKLGFVFDFNIYEKLTPKAIVKEVISKIKDKV